MASILVVGGNGFIGSAICRAALAHGMTVISISSSGRPFRSPKGHTPEWTSQVTWLAADALVPDSYSGLLPRQSAVVHTLGTLLEGTEYKEAVRRSDPLGLAGSVLRGLSAGVFGTGNPLGKGSVQPGSYESLNRESALAVCDAFISSTASNDGQGAMRRPFIYLSAEDIFRPFIPARYIETKREAEQLIALRLQGRTDLRAAFIRPSLVYHAYYRPLTTPLAVAMDLSNAVHRRLSNSLPTPAGVLRALGSATSGSRSNGSSQGIDLEPSPLASMANAMTVPPIHVDHVAEAVCEVILDGTVEGVVDVRRMHQLIGWEYLDQDHLEHSTSKKHL